MNENTICIPLGTNCSASFILKKMGLRTFSLPFDWVDSPVSGIHAALVDLLELNKNMSINKRADIFVSQYIRLMSIQRHKIYGIWHPHDVFSNKRELIEIRKKYVRRIERFINIINDGSRIVFLTVCPAPSSAIESEYKFLLDYLRNAVKSQFHAVSINMTFDNSRYFITEGCLHIPLHLPTHGWQTWDEKNEWENKCVEVLTEIDIFQM